MGFLDQLKSQAQSLQTQRSAEEARQDELTTQTDRACRVIATYLDDLARQLSVIEPPAREMSLDGRTQWPPMKQVDFRVDARRKMLRNREVFDYIGMGWRIVPQAGPVRTGVVSVNFPTEMKRVEDRLMMGPVKHERREIRDAEKSTLREVRYEYLTETRAAVTATPDHDRGLVHFRLLNTSGFEVRQTTWPAERIRNELLDELAKRIVGQPGEFV